MPLNHSSLAVAFIRNSYRGPQSSILLKSSITNHYYYILLGGEQKSAGKKMQKVMWDTSLNRVQKNDVKVRRLHLEVVKARVLRAKMMARRRPVSE